MQFSKTTLTTVAATAVTMTVKTKTTWATTTTEPTERTALDGRPKHSFSPLDERELFDALRARTGYRPAAAEGTVDHQPTKPHICVCPSHTQSATGTPVMP